MKYVLALFFIVSGLMNFISCSPVDFGKKEVPTQECPPASPCLVGNGIYEVEEIFTFNFSNKVDILIVDDNSTSMNADQVRMGEAFNGFISNLNSAGLDWRIAVTSTDVCPVSDGICPGNANVPSSAGSFMGPAGASPKYSGNYVLSKETPNVESVFKSYINRKRSDGVIETGSGDERGIYAAIKAIQKRGESGGKFFRSGAALVVIILSDEDERSTGGQDGPDMRELDDHYDSIDGLLTEVATAFGSKLFQLNAIVVPPFGSPDAETCMKEQLAQPPPPGTGPTAWYGNVYAQAALATTKGRVNSICESGSGQFAKMLNGFSDAITQLPKSQIVSVAHSIKSVLKVTINGQPIPYTWPKAGLGANQIWLNNLPSQDQQVHVRYTFEE